MGVTTQLFLEYHTPMKTYVVGVQYSEDGYEDFKCEANSSEEAIEKAEQKFEDEGGCDILFVYELKPDIG